MTGEYLTYANFRIETLQDYTAGLALTTEEAPDTGLTNAIARHSQRFDNATNDHFSSETPITLTLTGDGTSRLTLPRRCTAITSIAIVNYAGTSTAQTASYYRLHSSLDAGVKVRSPGALDYVDVVENRSLTGLTSGSGCCWPTDTNSVTLIGTFGWTTTPTEVKRAVALLVYAEYKPQADILGLVQQWNDAGTTYQRAAGTFGIPRVDEIAAAYTHGQVPGATGPLVLIG